ncbi:hypothetical protein GCM10009780_27210 [Actinomadura alba]
MWQREVPAARPARRREPPSPKRALYARLEELRFRSGVTMLVTTAGVLALVVGGVGIALHDGAGGSAQGPRMVGASTGSSPTASPPAPSASADPTRGERVPPLVPVTPGKVAPPPRSVDDPATRPAPRTTERPVRRERPEWRQGPHQRDRDRSDRRRWRDRPWWRHR